MWLSLTTQFQRSVPLRSSGPRVLNADVQARLIEAQNLLQAGRLDEAEQLLRGLLASSEKSLGLNSIEIAAIITDLTEVLIRNHQASNQESLRLATRAVSIAENAKDPILIESLKWRGALMRERGELTAARADLERAKATQEAMGTPDTLGVEENLAEVFVEQGLYAEARQMLEGIVARKDDIKDLTHVRYALARLLVRMGEYSTAERSYKEIISACAATARTAEDTLLIAYLQNGLAYCYDEIQDYPKARDMYNSAKVSVESAEPQSAMVGTILNNLGYLHKNLGSYSLAKECYERALERFRAIYGPESTPLASTLGNLAGVYCLEGNYNDAEPLYLQALQMRENIQGPNHPSVATSLQDLGDLHFDTGDLDKAMPLFERSLSIRSASHHPDTWECLEALARGHDAAGEVEIARRLYAEGLASIEAAAGSGSPRCVDALRNLAWFEMRSGDHASALAHAVRAETLSMQHARLMASSLPEQQALRYASVRPEGLHICLSLAAEDRREQVIETAWDMLIRSRALVLDETAARRRALEFDDPETERVATAYADASKRLAHLLLTNNLASEEFQQHITQAREDRERWEGELAKRSPEFRVTERRRHIGLKDVRESLPPSSALVAFVRFVRWTPELGVKGIDHRRMHNADASREYLAFVLKDGKTAPAVVPLGPAETIDHLVEEWSREIVRAAVAENRARSRLTYRSRGAKLRAAMWDPLKTALGDCDLVFMVPDGELHRINLASLPIGDDSYLIEFGRAFHYLAAERDLTIDTPAGSTTKGLLAMGGAEFDAKLSSTASSSIDSLAEGPFRPLPATTEEVRAVAAMWTMTPNRAPAANKSDEVALLTGADATEEAFKRLATGRQVLHLATHGFFLDGDNPRSPGVRAIGQTDLMPETQSPAIPGGNPLRLSGLALAGANRVRTSDPDEEDGIVTAEEIAAMNLNGTEWAVLSACETGVGTVQDIEGIVGLRRAFQVAGVRTLIMSLWPVEDVATRTWMEALYKSRLERQRTTAQAVREATLAVLQADRARPSGEHPFYWAAFVAAGDWH
jgi:CHAT domain-containing protein/tetratricopeptide (TPR) repeat protein